MQVRIRVRTKAKREGVRLLPDGRLEVSVREEPKGGRANERVIELIALHLKVAPKSVRIVRGHTTPTKVLIVSAQ